MTRRMIDSSMWQNEKFAEMPPYARLLQIGIINLADDQGRVKATPKYLQVQIFPYDDIAMSDIQVWLETLQKNGTILLYVSDGKQYAQLINWWGYQSLQYAQPSTYPRPKGWKDRIRKTLTKGYVITCNWLKVNGEPMADTCDQDGNPLPNGGGNKPDDHPSPKPPPEQPSVHVNGSGESSGGHSGESLAEDTIELNRTKLNRIELNEKVSSSSVADEIAEPQHRTPAAAALPDEDVAKYSEFVKEYEKVWGLMLTQYHADKVKEWCDRVPIEAWSYALKECADHRNTGKWKYFESILQRVEADGLPSSNAVKQSVSVQGVVNIGLAAV